MKLCVELEICRDRSCQPTLAAEMTFLASDWWCVEAVTRLYGAGLCLEPGEGKVLVQLMHIVSILFILFLDLLVFAARV